MTKEATQPGVSEGDQPAAPAPDPDTPLAPEYVPNPRDVILDRLETQIDEQRTTEQREFLEENAEELGLALPALEPAPDADGAKDVQPMHPPAEPATPEALPADMQEHPMADFIVMHNGAPHMKAKVHGIDKLIPMDKVQAQAQKLEAAEVSLEQAALLTKDLNQREEWIRQNEASLKVKMDVLAETPLPAPGATEEEILGEAKDIVSNLFRGDEDTAAEKLAKLLKRSQAPAVAAPAIDTTQLANEAAVVAVAKMTEIDRDKDAVTGLEQFGVDYPEIMADPILYKVADNLTDVVETEHPEWSPSQIMLEAGSRTKKWWNETRGVKDPDNPAPPPEEPAAKDTNRQERKDNLVRIPNPALGAVSPHGAEKEPEQTPSDALAEIRESRGQPV